MTSLTLRHPPPRTTGAGETARWYAERLGWRVTGDPPQLPTGERFDALRLPAEAGMPLLARGTRTGPVVRSGDRMWLLLAEGSAEQLPELLRWLEWGSLAAGLGLTALGAGDRVPAPAPPGPAAGARVRGLREAAEWVRPPAPTGSDRGLPALWVGGRQAVPDLARLVGAAATECHRARLRGAHRVVPTGGQPLAFS